ncbi:cytochrome P450 [Actinomadura madurae]|uniref:cytochrome P450 n=2 Tax=Actinomadura madurae TaxID=1993 RepID=UPI0020D2013E|nr:cytochrome P450 [Actinomadura madurae]MCP9955903.1 cytochrome P450 [Actinomadura madurae]MCP9972635.1 cytochrome P450 [Actinomadura madurae]MCQ0012431.1 cytochrome P450 [Actinomadura madurae]MCQ0021366.1 cytochrome P450 [Actinomadura madurae]
MDPQTPHAEPLPAHPPLESLAVQPLLNRDYEARPAVFFERLRAEYGPVAPVDVLGVPAWLVIGYAQTLDILRDTRGVWSRRVGSWRAYRDGAVPADWPMLPVVESDNCGFRDGAESTRLRSAWSEGLRPFQDRTRSKAKALEQAVRRYADELITVLSENGGPSGWADLSAQYARPLPLMVIGRLLGSGADSGDELIIDLWRVMDAGPGAQEASERLTARVADLCAARIAAPGDDLPSAMLAAVPDLTADELTAEMAMMTGLVGDVTGTLICNTITEVLIGDTGARDSLSAGLLQEAINRAAAANPPMANLAFRWARTDVRLGRFQIAAGDPVMVSPAAAHLDPAFTASTTPDSIYSSRAHLAWGAGPHACLGRDLATTITTIAVERLFDRFATLRLALPEDQLPWRSSPIMRGLRSLPVTYELAEAPTRPAPAPAEPEEDAEQDPPAGAGPDSLVRRVLRLMRIPQS